MENSCRGWNRNDIHREPDPGNFHSNPLLFRSLPTQNLPLLGIVLVVSIYLSSCTPIAPATASLPPSPPPTATPIRFHTYRILNVYPHDPAAFTQGLVFYNGHLYESTGLRGHSTLREVDLKTGQVLRQQDLAHEFFGEGLTLVGDKLVQLTLSSGRGFVYQRDNFSLVQEFQYPTEGWGITFDGEQLIMSDGSATLYFLDPQSFEVMNTLPVHDAGQPVDRLNELEFVEGEVLANVWQTDQIVRISPDTGQVAGWINLSGLLGDEDRSRGAGVLNGIAYDPEGRRLFVTGKNWPALYQIELLPAEPPKEEGAAQEPQPP